MPTYIVKYFSHYSSRGTDGEEPLVCPQWHVVYGWDSDDASICPSPISTTAVVPGLEHYRHHGLIVYVIATNPTDALISALLKFGAHLHTPAPSKEPKERPIFRPLQVHLS